MAAAKKKQTENFAFQIDVETDAQWRQLIRREGLIVVDVYASWAGPCVSMISTLKRVKVEINDEKLWLATAKSDDIADLLMFKDQSEPTWLFIGGGKPVKVLRGAHAPKLITTIKAEFEREMLCMQGKQKRNLISIDDEVSRRRKAEAEAIRLVKFIKEEEETAEQLNELRKESSLRLIKLMEPYTVLVIQSFLLETGVVTEVRDALQGDFKVEQERLVYLDEAAIRQLFKIPYKIPDPNQQLDDVVNGEEGGEGLEEEVEEEAEGGTGTEVDETKSTAGSLAAGEEGGGAGEADDDAKPKKKAKKNEKKWIEIPLPDGLVGDTLILLLESVEVRAMIAAGKTPDKNSVLQTADDYIQLKVGPVNLKDAQEHAPYSFHALYGKSQHEPGVWCPRRYDDKRYVMVNYFPRFVTDILVPPSSEGPKYTVAIYPAEMAAEIGRQTESFKKDVVAEGAMKIPKELVEAMAATWNKSTKGGDQDLQARKQAIMDKKVYALSVNKKNSALMLALNQMQPLHLSADVGYGKVETAKLFTSLELNVEDVTNPDEVIQKFLARTPLRVASLSEFAEKEMPKKKTGADNKEGAGAGASAGGEESEGEVKAPSPTGSSQSVTDGAPGGATKERKESTAKPTAAAAGDADEEEEEEEN